MNYATIKYVDIANGLGVRTSLFVSGCTHRCPGCFNSDAWDFDAGVPFDEEAQQAVLNSLAPAYITGLTILGGEPMEPQNQRSLLPFLKKVRATYPKTSIWLYTGDTLEELQNNNSSRHTENTEELLSLLDVLVDGRFEEDKKDITLKFRGSSNQRLIDMPATLASKRIVQLKL